MDAVGAVGAGLLGVGSVDLGWVAGWVVFQSDSEAGPGGVKGSGEAETGIALKKSRSSRAMTPRDDENEGPGMVQVNPAKGV